MLLFLTEEGVFPLGAIQIICDTLGGGGGPKNCGKSVMYYLNSPLCTFVVSWFFVKAKKLRLYVHL